MSVLPRGTWNEGFARRSPHFGCSSSARVRRLSWSENSSIYSEKLPNVHLAPTAPKKRRRSADADLKRSHLGNGNGNSSDGELGPHKLGRQQLKPDNDDLPGCSATSSGSSLNDTADTTQLGGDPSSVAEAVDDGPTLPPKNRVRDLFDWLLEEDWAEQYYSDVSGIKIGFNDQISHDEAKQRLRDAGFGDVVEACTITAPHRGKYEPTADTNHNHTTAAADIQLKPLSVVQSSSSAVVLYSGSIGSPLLPETGLSVAHAFNEANSDDVLSLEGRIPIAKLLLAIDVIKVGSRTLTADISFLRITNPRCKTTNHVTLSGGEDSTEKTLVLRLLKEDINAGTNVLIIDQNSHVRRGKISKDYFVDKKNKLYNVLQITDVDSPRMITDTGDSGALVMLADSQDGEETVSVKVVGIVLGKWESSMDETSATIANRIWDVLQAVGKNEDHCRQLTKHGEVGLIMDVDFAGA